MASLIRELTTILSREQEIYHMLLPIAEEKTKVIVQNNLEALQKITEQEQDIVQKIHVLERKRDEVIFNIATVLNKDPNTLTLAELVRLLDNQPEEQEELSHIHDNLKRTVHRLMEINHQNRSLIEQSLEMIEFNMNLIQSTRMSPGNNYTKGATEAETPVLQPGMFDAKQ